MVTFWPEFLLSVVVICSYLHYVLLTDPLIRKGQLLNDLSHLLQSDFVEDF